MVAAWSDRLGRCGRHVAFALGLAGATACSVNPATGRLQLTTIDEKEEVALGKQADEELRQAMRVYDGGAPISKLVDKVGHKVAAQSERPDLPWTFRVLDDPTVNAFALPGGYVYVTRGLLGHLNSEAELAAVLGHETGHVTARHGVVQLRKRRTAQRSVGLFRIIDPNLRHVGGLAARGAALALLKHSRDDEHQADDLGLRYLRKAGYEESAVTEVFGVLAGISKGHGKMPTWLSTHPEPKQRRARMAEQIGPAANTPPELDVEYLKLIDGIPHGADARDGFFVGDAFYHPRVGFQLSVPAGWEGEHNDTGVVALSPNKEALFVLAPSGHDSAKKAFEAFFADKTVAKGEQWEGKVGGYHVLTCAIAIQASDGRVTGLLAFIDYRGGVLAMLAVGPESTWENHSDPVAKSFASFASITDPRILKIDPMRIRIENLPREMTLKEFAKARPSVVPVDELAVLNHVDADEKLEKGRAIKRVVGFNPALAKAPR